MYLTLWVRYTGIKVVLLFLHPHTVAPVFRWGITLKRRWVKFRFRSSEFNSEFTHLYSPTKKDVWNKAHICGAFNKFPDFFVQAFKIVVDSWKFSFLLLCSLWDDWPIFMISGSNEQLQQELEYTLLKPDCHSWWISKMQSGRLDTLEERYAIKFCFKLGKNPTETYGMLQTTFRPSCVNQASVFE